MKTLLKLARECATELLRVVWWMSISAFVGFGFTVGSLTAVVVFLR